MSGLYLAADDLTGALDSAVPFCGEFGPIPVFLGAPHDDRGPHAAVDLATRDASSEFAMLSVAHIAHRMATADIAYKKIDSLLRGHWAIELAGLMKAMAFRLCIFAPAFPSQGRTTRLGRQIVRAADGSLSAIVPVDPVEALGRLGLRVVRAAVPDSANPDALTIENDVVIFDVATDDDLRSIVRWGSRLNKPLLWCGSGGLARALAQHEAPRTAAIQKPVLAIIGTDHVVSKTQIAHAVARGATCQIVIGNDIAGDAATITDAFERMGSCLVTFAFPDGALPEDAAACIDDKLGALLRQIPRPSTLLVSGGKTLLSVCRAVGASYLDVDAEFGPGVPRSRLRAGRWDGVGIVSKSGGFGHPQWLAEMISAAH